MSGVVLGLPAIARSDPILASHEPALHDPARALNDLVAAPITQTLVRALPVLHAVSGLVVSIAHKPSARRGRRGGRRWCGQRSPRLACVGGGEGDQLPFDTVEVQGFACCDVCDLAGGEHPGALR